MLRNATPYDIPVILDMLRHYRQATPVPFFEEIDDAEYITNLLTEIMAGKGVALVAEKPHVVGMLLAVVMPSIWSPRHLLLTELAYWVEPEHRGSSIAYRLLKAYEQIGEQLKMEGRVQNYLISKMVNSPDLRYDRFGFRKLEEFWVH